uniref:Quinolinate phosphoribosyl transferase C-terminal domain-containing protein n=1 Tax=Glossina pallidipes TaxID=7398 RepID=A0A1A9Z119_GLOPL
MGLFDSILIKDNHIKHSQSIKYLVSMAKLNFPHLPIEIEVENLEEFQEALDAKTDIIMLDNFSYQNVKRAVEMNKNKAILEASGNLTIKNLVQFASTGVDYLAIGKFTKDITSLDFTMHVN